ncbi:hypothetical protein [Microvirga sp. KLBC 81]|uniref:hypothetical protein n=1 Tax=Microvirga sp. KLBC 81 TaxID=1862707 RepID=UPI001057A98E|nr:hypothetical protein [Microvirga sp. KLBC 81]
MTIIALLRHSLANLQRRSAKLAQHKTRSTSETSYGFWSTLIAARLQEAELLVNGYIQQPDNTSAGESVRRLNGWAFHR